MNVAVVLIQSVGQHSRCGSMDDSGEGFTASA